MNYNLNDTISAISTPIGEGAISIIRLSGKNAVTILNKMFSKDARKFENKKAYLGKIFDDDKNLIDTTIVILYKSPASYTGDDIVEIQCHGGRLITQKIFEITLKKGARAAHPGEFTFRAYQNGKIDLIQAESIQQLISAKNEFSLKAAKNHLEGFLSEKIKNFQKDLTQAAATLEVWLDFPEEDLEFQENKEILNKMENILIQMEDLSNTFDDGEILKEGKSICLIGSVNVGKSSLMNSILRKNRAIVTNIKGTTRDILREDILINNLNYQLIDTAGIRKTSNTIEKIGISKSQKEKKKSDIVILVLDASRKLDENDKNLIKDLNPQNSIIAVNKIDLKDAKILKDINFPNIVKISAKNHLNISSLFEEIKKLTFKSNISNDEIFITQKRHKIALDQACSFLKKAIFNFSNSISFEFILIDLKSSLKELQKIIGFDITEDILTSIFSNFCIGK